MGMTETLEQRRATLVNALKAGKGWMTGYAEAFVDQYAEDAATVRQQAFSQFANPEALADWLDALHECHADGSVGNRKWEAAQVAARAIRSLNEPSGNSGQLRQQAGRVDVPRRKASDYADGTYGPEDLAAIWNVCCEQHKKAALAQNTQGEAVVHLSVADEIEATPLIGAARLPHGDYMLHAERARVPDSDRIDWMEANARSVSIGKAPQQGYWVHVQGIGYSGGSNKSLRDAIDAAREAQAAELAAAPSQRAEVK